MSERTIVTMKDSVTVNPNKKKKRPLGTKELPKVSIDAQERLVEILTDSPRLVNLRGTEWEVRALRMGTQWLIAKKCVEIAKAESSNFGDVIKQFSTNIPAVLDVLTLALLNDKEKLFKDGNERNGFSDLYYATRNTLEWECDVTEFGYLLFDVLSMLSVDFFYQALDMLEIFRASVTEMKRTRIAEQK